MIFDLMPLFQPEPKVNHWWAEAINEPGNVVGGYVPPAGSASTVIWKTGSIPDVLPVAGKEPYVGEDINDTDTVVGSYNWASPFGPHAFLYSNGQFKDLHSVLASSEMDSIAKGINNDGIIVGFLTPNNWTTDTPTQAFIYDLNGAGPPTVLPHDRKALAINAAGHVLGVRRVAQVMRGFILRNGQISDVGVVDWANAINSGDVVTGARKFGASPLRAFRLAASLDPPVFEDLGGSPVAGYSRSIGVDINDAGVIVGYSWPDDSSGSYRAFVHFPASSPDAGWHDLDDLVPSAASGSWQLERATGINNQGEIVGEASYSGTTWGFRLTPGVYDPMANKIGSLMAGFMMLLGGVESGGGGVGIGGGGKPHPIDPHGPFTSAWKAFFSRNPDLFLGNLLGKLVLLTDNPRTRELLVTTGRSILEKALDDAGKRGERPRDGTV